MRESPPPDSDTGDGARDGDGDGYWSVEAGGLDCDDTDPNIHPGVEEIIDGIDQDCDGLIDDGTDVYDGDQDGWTLGNGDCDDADPDTWPGAPENPCDAQDQDCDGELGVCTRADVAFALFSATEGRSAFGLVVGGGDFSGDDHPDLATGLAGIIHVFSVPPDGGYLTGADSFVRIGRIANMVSGDMMFVGDFGNNGLDALLIGTTQSSAPGLAYLLCGPATGEIIAEDSACAIYTDNDSTSSFGWEVAGGPDLTGDGVGDLLIGAPYATNQVGVAYIISGDLRGDVDVSRDGAQIWGDIEQDRAGYSLAMAGDNNGDGVGDVLIGARGSNLESERVAWFMGPVPSLATLSDADVLYTADEGPLSGYSMDGGGDFDGDGRQDFALTTWDEGIGGVYIFTDYSSGSLDGAAARLLGVEHADYSPTMGDYLGYSLSHPDANGDGLSDVFAGAPFSMMGGYAFDEQHGLVNPSGAAALFLAPFLGTRTMLEAEGLWFGAHEDDYFGVSVSSAGDVNGDGIDDLLAGASNYDDPNDAFDVRYGAIFLFLGKESW